MWRSIWWRRFVRGCSYFLRPSAYEGRECAARPPLNLPPGWGETFRSIFCQDERAFGVALCADSCVRRSDGAGNDDGLGECDGWGSMRELDLTD